METKLSERIFAIIILIFIIIVTLGSILSNNKTEISDKSAFRKQSEIDYNNVMLDDEAIALSESMTNTSLRAEAIKAYNIVNEIREDNNLGQLEWNQNLESVANVRAKEISESFSHTRPNGNQWYSVNSQIQGGENLAYGFNEADDTVEAWMNSPTHKDNILYEDFTKVAISIYEKDGVYYWSQEYGY